MIPVHAQLHVELTVSAFFSRIITTVDPWDHGAVTTGMQGIGVRTPCAAAVALATCGFACVVHIPNGAMFTDGWKSVTVAIGFSSPSVRSVGSTESDDGDVPWLHRSVAPWTTSFGICSPENTRACLISPDGALARDV